MNKPVVVVRQEAFRADTKMWPIEEYRRRLAGDVPDGGAIAASLASAEQGAICVSIFDPEHGAMTALIDVGRAEKLASELVNSVPLAAREAGNA